MTTFVAACAVIGALVLLLQVVGALLGVDHEQGHLFHGVEEGLDLLAVRPLAAGGACFGLAGVAALCAGLGLPLALPLAAAVGAVAAVAVAWLTRGMLRFEHDGAVRIHGAVGATGTVHLGIPAANTGRGKVHLTLQNRFVELDATTHHHAPLPAGSAVLVVDVVGTDVVDVVPDPLHPDPTPRSLERPHPRDAH